MSSDMIFPVAIRLLSSNFKATLRVHENKANKVTQRAIELLERQFKKGMERYGTFLSSNQNLTSTEEADEEGADWYMYMVHGIEVLKKNRLNSHQEIRDQIRWMRESISVMRIYCDVVESAIDELEK